MAWSSAISKMIEAHPPYFLMASIFLAVAAVLILLVAAKVLVANKARSKTTVTLI